MPAKLNANKLLEKPDVQKILEYWCFDKDLKLMLKDWKKYQELKKQFVKPYINKKKIRTKKQEKEWIYHKNGKWIDPKNKPLEYLYDWENQLERRLKQLVENDILEQNKEKEYRPTGKYTLDILKKFQSKIIRCISSDNILSFSPYVTFYLPYLTKNDFVEGFKKQQKMEWIKYIDGLFHKALRELMFFTVTIKNVKINKIWVDFINDKTLSPLLKFYYFLRNIFLWNISIRSIPTIMKNRNKKTEYKKWVKNFDELLIQSMCKYLLEKFPKIDYQIVEKMLKITVNDHYKANKKKIDNMQRDIFSIGNSSFTVVTSSEGGISRSFLEKEKYPKWIDWMYYSQKEDNLKMSENRELDVSDLFKKKNESHPKFLVQNLLDNLSNEKIKELRENFFIKSNFFKGFEKELYDLDLVYGKKKEITGNPKNDVEMMRKAFETIEELYNVLNNNSKIFFMPSLSKDSDELLKWYN